MLTYRQYTEVANAPFLLMLSNAMRETRDVQLYVTGEYAFCCVTGRQLPKSAELRGNLSRGEMLALCEQKHFEYSVYGQEVLIIHNDRRYMYGALVKGNTADDAKAHDFTINSIYISVQDGEAEDPLDALSDINNSVLRCPDDPHKLFSQKTAAMLHMVRIACEYDFSVDDDMLSAAKNNAYRLANLSGDTVRNALSAILMSDTARAYEGRDVKGDRSPVLRGLLMLRNMDAFAYMIPELEAGRGVEQKKRYHMHDVQGHMLHTCAETPPRLYMRFAGLLHDIGKPEAHRQNEGKNMHGHDRIGAMMARNILQRLHCKDEFISKVCRIIAIHMYDVAGIAKPETLRKRFALWGYRLTQDLIDFRFADVAGSGCPERKSDSALRFREVFEQMQAENAPFSIYELRIAGREIADIMGLHSGAEINEVKRDMLRMCAVTPSLNERNTLARIALEMKNGADIAEN